MPSSSWLSEIFEDDMLSAIRYGQEDEELFFLESQSCNNNRPGNFEIFVFKLSLSKKNYASEEVQLSWCCVIAEHENLCSVEGLGWCVCYTRGGCALCTSHPTFPSDVLLESKGRVG